MIQRWEYYRDESPDGTFVGVRSSPVGQFVSYHDHLKEVDRLRNSYEKIISETSQQKTSRDKQAVCNTKESTS